MDELACLRKRDEMGHLSFNCRFIVFVSMDSCERKAWTCGHTAAP